MSTSRTSSPSHSTLPLLSLAVGAFGIGTTEFGPMGMLPTIAQGMDVSIPTAGMLISAYAIGVMVGAPVMTLLFARWPRRRALIALMAIFTLGNLASAMAPNYTSLVIARIITSLNHGAFFGIGSIVAASLVPREKQASAVAAMFMGLTIANIGGVPVATWFGQVVGWRESFMGIALLGVAAMLSLGAFLPKGGHGERPNVQAELRVLTQPVVLVILATTVMGAGAMFTLYTYIAPSLESITQVSPGYVTGMLVLIGIGFTLGAKLGGKLADRSVKGSLLVFLSLIAISMLAFPWLATTKAGAAMGLVVWGTAAFAVVPPLQTWVMREATGAPGLASSVNIGAFNLGNALGAALGSAVLNLGGGYGAVSISGAVLALLALLLVLTQMRHKQTDISGETTTEVC